MIARGVGHESVTELGPWLVLQSQHRHLLGCGARCNRSKASKSWQTLAYCKSIRAWLKDHPCEDAHADDRFRRNRHPDEAAPTHQAVFAISLRSIGMRVMRTPVAAKTALAIAGCTTTVPGSPMPPGSCVLETMWASIEGISSIRSIR
jgi:hypothetical protein